jgi:hypothetical protein
MSDNEEEWVDFFKKFFGELKRMILEHYEVEENGSGPPEVLAIREVSDSFPCPIRVAQIKIDIKKHKHITDEICQIVRFDFSRLGAQEDVVEYYGVVDAEDSEKLRKLLIEKFDMIYSFEEFSKDLTLTAWSDDETTFVTYFPHYDIKKKWRRFLFDFWTFGFDFLADKICQERGKGIDWNSRFDLKPDQILSISEITKMDKTLSAFSLVEDQGLEKLQEDVRNIQLIPKVPDDVKRAFRHSKDLFIYGYFRYSFFTIAEHYAYLTLESAIKNRYYQSFGEENVLKNKKGKTVKIGKLDHQAIMDFCRRKGWDYRELKVNGEKFRFSMNGILDWLVEEEIMPIWKRKQCRRGMDLRNIMSHLTQVIIFPPGHSIQALKFVADIINKLYCNAYSNQ